MDDKKFNEIMHEYAKSEKSSSNKAFSKLEMEERKTSKIGRKQRGFVIACAAMMAVIVLTLCITLPIVLNKKGSDGGEAPQTTYCDVDDLTLNIEENVDVLRDVYGVNATLPTFDAKIASVLSITSKKYQGLKGCKINYEVSVEPYFLVDFVAIKNDYIVDSYSHYHDLEKQVEWSGTVVKYDSIYDEEIFTYINTVFFADDEYFYYIKTESDDEVSIIDLLNLMYAE